MLELLGLLMCLDSGHYVNMMSTELRPGRRAQLETNYLDTTNMCIELFYRSESSGSINKPIISIYLITEEKEKRKLVSSTGWEPDTWNRMFAILPSGIFQIAIEGNRTTSGVCGMSVDDVIVQSCSKFGKAFFPFPVFLVLWSERVYVNILLSNLSSSVGTFI